MATVDYFLKIDGIDGESTDNKHKNEIDVLSWSWGKRRVGLWLVGVEVVPAKSPCKTFTSS